MILKRKLNKKKTIISKVYCFREYNFGNSIFSIIGWFFEEILNGRFKTIIDVHFS